MPHKFGRMIDRIIIGKADVGKENYQKQSNHTMQVVNRDVYVVNLLKKTVAMTESVDLLCL